MAEVIVNPLLKRIHGKIGGLVFKKYGSGTIIAQTPGPRTTPPTPGQQAQQERFKLAAVYGHTALADPVTGALYRARAEAKGQPVFSVAVADFFNPNSEVGRKERNETHSGTTSLVGSEPCQVFSRRPSPTAFSLCSLRSLWQFNFGIRV